MKKTLLIFCFALTSFLSFSQVKHITFTDSVVVNNGVPISSYKINSIPNSSDYILSSLFYDGHINLYFAKLDFEGAVISNGIFRYTPPGMYGNSITSAIATENDFTIFSSFPNVQYRTQPFIAKYDIYGNEMWNKYYTIDTSSFNNVGGLQTHDGGFVSYGNFDDMVNSRSLSYVLRTDNMGVVQWSNFYGAKDASLSQFSNKIFKLTETKDNGLLMTSIVKTDNFSPNENLINITKLDNLGNKLWSKAIHFDAPLSNSISSSPEIEDITIVDSSAAIISMKIQDISSSYKFVLMSINSNSGDVNWTKSYGFPATNVVVEKVLLNKENQLVAYYNHDALGGVALKIDINGTILSSISNQELPTGATTTYYDMDTTSDGGSIISGSRAAGSGTILFKTDKNFKTSCPENLIAPFPNYSPASFTTYNFNDTILPVTFTENSLALTQDTMSSFNNKYCYCINEIYGNIAYSAVGIPADSVKVYLYQINSLGKHVLIDSAETDVSAYYQFSFLEEGQYYVKAEPSKTKYPGYLPSYYNMPSSVAQWDSAFVINLQCGNNPISYNINLIPKLPQTGGWVCSGYVYEYYGYLAGGKKAAGEPLPDIDISINQSPGGAVSSTTTDSTGHFEFTGLNNNVTFTLKVDLPGFPNDSIYTFSVTPGTPALDSLNFYVSADSVFIFPVDMFIGVNLISENDFNMNISPNPTKSSFVLDISSTKNTELNVALTNTIGEVVLTNRTNLNVGFNKVDFELQNKPPGIYFMSINFDNKHFMKKIIKQ